MHVYIVRHINLLMILITYKIFMFHSMVEECIMTHWQKFSIFWQQAGRVEIHIVLINTTNQVR